MLQIATAGDFEERLADGFEGLFTSEDHVNGMQLEELEEWEKELETRIERLKDSAKYRETFAGRMLQSIGGQLMQPGRMSTLSMEEEEAGVKATWKEFDAALWLAAFGDEDDLVKVVADAGQFMEQRSSAVIGFSDQIPVWVKIGRKKQVYCGDEVKKRKTTADFKELKNKRQAAIKNKEAAEEAEDKKDDDEEAEDKKEDEEEAEEKKEAEEQDDKAAEEAEEKKEAAEEDKDAAKEAEEQKNAKEDTKEAAEEDEEEDYEDMPPLVDDSDDEDDMKKVFMQQVEVEDPNANESEDDDVEQAVVEMNGGVLVGIGVRWSEVERGGVVDGIINHYLYF